jgi:hypothetical protein
MANVYYLQSFDQHGFLRAVLSSEQCEGLLNGHSTHYVGLQFPALGQDEKAAFAVLRVFEGEMNGECRSGFYRFDDDITQMEIAVQACEARLSQKA